MWLLVSVNLVGASALLSEPFAAGAPLLLGPVGVVFRFRAGYGQG